MYVAFPLVHPGSRVLPHFLEFLFGEGSCLVGRCDRHVAVGAVAVTVDTVAVDTAVDEADVPDEVSCS